MSRNIDIATLANFSPLSGLKKDNRYALAKKTEVREAANGEFLFQEGDPAKRTVYVLTGTVEILNGHTVSDTIVGGTPEARNPL